MYEAKIAFLQAIETRFQVGARRRSGEERICGPDQGRSIHDRRRHREGVHRSEKVQPHRVTAGEHLLAEWRLPHRNAVVIHRVGTDDPDRGMSLGEVDQLRHAFGIYPIVCRHEFAVLGVGGDRAERAIVVLDDTDELFRCSDSDLWVRLGILLCDRQRAIRAAVVDDRVVPIVVGLSQHALDTSAQVLAPLKTGVTTLTSGEDLRRDDVDLRRLTVWRQFMESAAVTVHRRGRGRHRPAKSARNSLQASARSARCTAARPPTKTPTATAELANAPARSGPIQCATSQPHDADTVARITGTARRVPILKVVVRRAA